jgi:hypothetical protein
LAFAIAIHAMLAMTGPMLTGMGLPRYELKAQIITLIFSLPALVFAARQSFTILLYTLLGTYLLRFLMLSIAALIALKESPFRLLRVLIIPLSVALLLYGCAYYTNQFQLGFVYDVKLRLLGNITSCAICYVLFLLIFIRLIVRGAIKDILFSIKARLPKLLTALAGI